MHHWIYNGITPLRLVNTTELQRLLALRLVVFDAFNQQYKVR
jgi:hypothetical protein